MKRTLGVILSASLALACSPAPSSLGVQLRTDLAPTREFDEITVVVSHAGAADRTSELRADRTRAYGRPVRLVDLPGLEDGSHRVLVTLRLAGAVVQAQTRRVEVRGATTVTVVVTRDCGGVTCPSASAPAAEACLGGRCVDPGCGEPGAPSCGTECAADADCPPSGVACVTTRCASGVCFAEADDDLCATGELCDTALGCTATSALPAPIVRVPANGTYTGSVFDTNPSHPQSSRYLLVRWGAVTGATDYQLQIDDSCDAATYESCAFASPEIDLRTPNVTERPGPLAASTTPPVGTRYFFRVRACAGECGPWSTPRYVSVGRQRNDLDGDGYADLAVGSPDVGAGIVSVFRGGPSGLPTTPDDTIPGGMPRFGFAMSAGDFEGDGFPSLAMSAEDASFVGVIRIATHFETGTPGTPTTIAGAIPTDQSFGIALAVGDVDADGYDDLVVGAPRMPGSTSRAGAVYVYHGGPTGLGGEQMIQVDDPDHGGLGRAVAVGDLDGDGIADIAAAAPDAPGSSSAGSGIVRVFRGVRRGAVDTVPYWTFSDPTMSSDASFGSALAIGDLSGDGIADLLIGAEQERTGASFTGAAYTVDGASAGTLVRIASPATGNALFGASVAIVRALGSDERGAAEIGAPFAGGTGGVFLAYGGSTSELGGGAPADAQFGWAVACIGDTDGDGFDELAVGAPEGSGPGVVSVLRGDVSASPGVVAPTPANPMAMDRFGWSFPQ